MDFGPAAMWAAYMRALETHPTATKVITSASLNGVGDILGQLIFEKDKRFDFLRFAKFTFLVRNHLHAICAQSTTPS